MGYGNVFHLFVGPQENWVLVPGPFLGLKSQSLAPDPCLKGTLSPSHNTLTGPISFLGGTPVISPRSLPWGGYYPIQDCGIPIQDGGNPGQEWDASCQNWSIRHWPRPSPPSRTHYAYTVASRVIRLLWFPEEDFPV